MQRVLAAVIATGLGLGPRTGSAGTTDGRSLGLGGAYASLATGAEGMWWNPAGLRGPKLVSTSIGGGVEGGNNALSISQIAGIATDDQAKKDDAVAAIREEGEWEARIQGGGGVAVTVWKVGVSYATQAFISAEDVSPDTAEFALRGAVTPEAGRTYDLHGSYTRAVYRELAAGYAHEFLKLIPGVKLNAGLALKYFQGVDYDSATTSQSFTFGAPAAPSSESTRDSATAGSGVGADLGVQASLLAGVVKASLVARNLGAKITWDAKRESGKFDQTTLTYVAPAPTTGDVEQALPSNYQLAASASIPVVGTTAAVAADLQTDPAAANRFRIGLEQPLLGVITFRGGYVTAAGPSPALVTCGLGLGTPSILPVTVRVDAGLGIALDGKGGAAGVSAYAAF